MFSHFSILVLALLIDRFAGDPPWLWKSVPHPVVWFGKSIELIERRLNGDEKSPYEKRRNGFAGMTVLLIIAAVAGLIIHAVLSRLHFPGLVVEAMVASVFLAQKSLADHVSKVAEALRTGGLKEGRKAVSMIVGRDPEQLDQPAVCRAAIETLAENGSDGVIAPAFWYLVAGLPGLFAYKMLNTADSMIGHLNDRHRDFGRFAARLDDVANWIPARVAGFLITLAAAVNLGGAIGARSLTAMLRDARLHASPNAGWPEAAMAGALGLALGGPRRYGLEVVNAPVLNAGGRREASVNDIHLSLTVFWQTMTLLTMLAGILAIL